MLSLQYSPCHCSTDAVTAVQLLSLQYRCCHCSTEAVTTVQMPSPQYDYCHCGNLLSLQCISCHCGTSPVTAALLLSLRYCSCHCGTAPVSAVQPGYVLGLVQNSGAAVLGRTSGTSNTSDVLLSSTTPSVGNTLTVSTGTVTNIRHAIIAIASAGSKVNLPFRFETPGSFVLEVVAGSQTLSSQVRSNTSTPISVQEGVNVTVISGPEYVKTGGVATFTVEPHSGSNVLYNWTFSDNTTILMTTNRSVSISFSQKGIYEVSVVTYNSVSFKSNSTYVYVQDEVTGLTVSSNATGNYTFVAPGSYTINVTCSNEVSSVWRTVSVQVQDQIVNFRLLTVGANINTPFNIEWATDGGTAVNFVLTLDGKTINYTRAVGYTNRWISDRQAGRTAVVLPLRLTASNAVSYFYIDANFTILTAIVNPSLTTTAVNATSHEPLKFTVNMDAGSDVNVTLDYGDGVSESYVAPLGSDWTAPYNFTHVYLNGGRFNVRASFKNAGSETFRYLSMLIRVGVGIIECDFPEYALYHPPAYVNLTLSAPVRPTEPTLTLNWGELTSRDLLYPNLIINQTFPYEYRDTGTFQVKAILTNLMGTKVCIKNITIVEKLLGPTFILPFKKAALNLPFVFNFCLFRGPSGDLCNLTFDFGNGGSLRVVQRQGQGKDGCDTQNVTFTSLGNYNVNVTASSPLEDISRALQVSVINGVKASDIVVTSNGDVAFGSDTIFTVTYSGSVPPDSANISFQYGDGSPLEVVSFSPVLTLRHMYVKDGQFKTNVSVYNDASVVNTTLQIGVYQAFSNLNALVYYLADKPPNATTYGFNNRSLMYPHNKDIYFNIVDDNNAYAASYSLTITDTNGVNSTTTFNTSVFTYKFPQSGVYTAYVTAWNPMFSASMAPKSITFIEYIEGFKFEEANNKTIQMNQEKNFTVSFVKVGTGTCLYIDYGDNVLETYAADVTQCSNLKFAAAKKTNVTLSTLTVFTHLYTEQRYYEVTALAMNDQSSETRVVGFSVSGMDCSKPTVTIPLRKPYFTSPDLYKRSDRIKVRALSNIECVMTYDNVKFWLVQRMNESFDTVIANITLTGIETSKAELNLPARYLDVGLYRIHYTMTMAGNVGSAVFASTTFTYIRGILVKNWTCEIPLQNINTGCTESGFTATGESQTLNIGKMNLTTYKITVNLYKDTREASAVLYVTVVDGDPPTASIAPAVGSVFYQISDGYKVLKSSRVALDCVCDNCYDNDAGFQWDIYLYDYRWTNGWRPLREDELLGRISGQRSKQIAIESSLFETFNASRMRAECTITKNNMLGKVATNLQINTPPSPGNCSISPYNRTITPEQAWQLNLAGWSDDDGLQEYQFFIHTTNNTVDKQITSYRTSEGSVKLNVSLSEAPNFLNYTQNIIVKVRDRLGAITTMDCGQVVVRPLPLGEIRALTKDIKNNQMNNLLKTFAEGDQKTCSEKATNMVSLLNSDSKQSRTGA
ncbi:hypothetical protein Btru_068873 [Bulinus truncatus]|nr:hypothetical protein Btru_068873 [Bulinus truncatus]